MKFTIQGRLASLNTYINIERRNKYAAASFKKEQEAIVGWAIKQYKLKPVKLYPVKLNIIWYEKNSRRDRDNIQIGTKFIQDALVKNGILIDDAPKYVKYLNNCEFHIDKEYPRIEIQIMEGI